MKAATLPLTSPNLDPSNSHRICSIPKNLEQENFKPERPPQPKQKQKRSQADKRIDFLLKTYFDGDPESRPLLLELADLDPTSKKKYLAWLVKHWNADWNPDDAAKRRITQHLDTHQKGAKYFSPLSWTGLRLEDAGYHADIFRYTPNTIGKLSGPISEIIRIDEEDKQIRKGNPVTLAGAEVAYRDERYTLIRIRTPEALRRLGQGTSWCVRNGRTFGYRFPFDFVLNSEGERYLANRTEVRDRWDRSPKTDIVKEINCIRELATDGQDRIAAKVRKAMKDRKRLDPETEDMLLPHHHLAIRYAASVIGGPWQRFEDSVTVAKLPASHAVEYAITCLQARWPRFENKIKRSEVSLASYRMAFPDFVPNTETKTFQEKLQAWRRNTPSTHQCPVRSGTQGRAESLDRRSEYEASLVDRPYSLDRYATLLASLATSNLADDYRAKLLSYFEDFETPFGKEVNLPIARMLCQKFCEPIKYLENGIAKDACCSLNYAIGIGARFLQGERVLFADREVWPIYQRRFHFVDAVDRRRKTWRGRLSLPSNIRLAWS